MEKGVVGQGKIEEVLDTSHVLLDFLRKPVHVLNVPEVDKTSRIYETLKLYLDVVTLGKDISITDIEIGVNNEIKARLFFDGFDYAQVAQDFVDTFTAEAFSEEERSA